MQLTICEDNSESKSDVGGDSDDGSEVAAQSHSQGVMNVMNSVGYASDDHVDDNACINVWTELEDKIRLGMQFETQCKSVHREDSDESFTVVEDSDKEEILNDLPL
ncbi:hypothetical protein Tco_0848712 [Tanacetum coccineum]|uniref:Uncharacterized protein n=1 Tax=Tanacetum coccineum TaxID=301880 RepID=A0ABQ5J538_9ASTR